MNGINTLFINTSILIESYHDIRAKECILSAHIHECCSSTIREFFFNLPGRQPDQGIVQLYLDERHIDWMSDVVLQHVLADLRPLYADIRYCVVPPFELTNSYRVIPKLQAEKDVHFGPGAAPSTKRGTVEVHRGGLYHFIRGSLAVHSCSCISETYQFAYFFRKTEPHTVLFKVGESVDPTTPGT